MSTHIYCRGAWARSLGSSSRTGERGKLARIVRGSAVRRDIVCSRLSFALGAMLVAKGFGG